MTKFFQEKKGKKDTAAAKEAVQDTKASSTTGDQKKKSNELEIKDVRVGNGPEAKIGKMVSPSAFSSIDLIDCRRRVFIILVDW